MSLADRRVSCVIPVYNGERFLGESLDSVLAQTHPASEVIVVDDGSTDATPAVVDRFPGVIVLRQPHAGVAAARNRGVARASGEFVAFLDADDLWREDKLARQLARFEAKPELGYCTTRQQNFWMKEVRSEAERLEDSALSRPQPGAASTLMVRRELFDRLGPFNEDLNNRDIQEWMLRAQAQAIPRELLTEVLVMRRIHDANTSRTRTGEEFLDIIKASLDRRGGSGSTGRG